MTADDPSGAGEQPHVDVPGPSTESTPVPPSIPTGSTNGATPDKPKLTDVALAENVIRAGQVAWWYSLRMPPKRGCRRMSS
jgi:hypothetical protein